MPGSQRSGLHRRAAGSVVSLQAAGTAGEPERTSKKGNKPGLRYMGVHVSPSALLREFGMVSSNTTASASPSGYLRPSPTLLEPGTHCLHAVPSYTRRPTACFRLHSNSGSDLARSAIPYSLYHYVMRLPFPSNTPQSELRLHCVEHNTPLQVGHTSSRGSQKRPTTYLSKALRPLAPHNKVTTPPDTNEPASSTAKAHYL